jgi:hypothetical protein
MAREPAEIADQRRALGERPGTRGGALTSSVNETRDHWGWRPGWKVGRSFYTWHVTFADQPHVLEFAASYASVVERLPMLDHIPLHWLHLTMQGVAFTDEVDQSDVDEIVTATHARCAGLDPFSVTLGPAEVAAEALKLPARPVELLIRVRSTVRQAIADVWGSERVPRAADGWIPPVSLAYSNTDGPAEPIFQARNPSEADHRVRVSAVPLIDVNRDQKMYQWTEVARVPLGQ